jgi:hypothetical protein
VTWLHAEELHRRPQDYATRLALVPPGTPALVGSEPEPITLAEVVHRAVEVVDPDGAHDGPAGLLARFADRDEPVTSLADVESELAEGAGTVDPQQEDPAVVMAAAVAVYLAHRRTELDDDREQILRLAARSEFDGNPPQAVADWLAAEGVRL